MLFWSVTTKWTNVINWSSPELNQTDTDASCYINLATRWSFQLTHWSVVLCCDVSRDALYFRIESVPSLLYVVGNPVINIYILMRMIKYKEFLPKCFWKKLSELIIIRFLKLKCQYGYWSHKSGFAFHNISVYSVLSDSCQHEVVHILYCWSTGVELVCLIKKYKYSFISQDFYLIIHISYLFILCIKLHSNHSLCDRKIMRFGKWSDKRKS